MNTTRKKRKKLLRSWIAGAVILFMAATFQGCGDSPEKAQAPAVTDSGKTDFAALVRETDRMLTGEAEVGKPGEPPQNAEATESTASPAKEKSAESGLAGHELGFYFPNRFEEDNYLEILGKEICDPATVAGQRKESAGLVSCAVWKARLKKAGTLLKMNISKYESGGKAWEAISSMRSTGGFIAGDVILSGDEEWPDTPEGQIEARSFIKSYYGRIRPTYVYRNEMGKPEDYLLENDRQLEALKAGK